MLSCYFYVLLNVIWCYLCDQIVNVILLHRYGLFKCNKNTKDIVPKECFLYIVITANV